jgi:hypothetical protein
MHLFGAYDWRKSTLLVQIRQPGAAHRRQKSAHRGDLAVLKKVGTIFALSLSSENSSCTTVAELDEIGWLGMALRHISFQTTQPLTTMIMTFSRRVEYVR